MMWRVNLRAQKDVQKQLVRMSLTGEVQLYPTSAGVSPYLFGRWMSVKGCDTRYSTISAWPYLHAKCKGVSQVCGHKPIIVHSMDNKCIHKSVITWMIIMAENSKGPSVQRILFGGSSSNIFYRVLIHLGS